ncbi:unnamed protein product [Arctogadus glacialis]
MGRGHSRETHRLTALSGLQLDVENPRLRKWTTPVLQDPGGGLYSTLKTTLPAQAGPPVSRTAMQHPPPNSGSSEEVPPRLQNIYTQNPKNAGRIADVRGKTKPVSEE